MLNSLFSPENLVHEDDRRAIYELNFPEFSVQGFIVKQRAPLGKHLHAVKHEVFKIISGGGDLYTAHVDKGGFHFPIRCRVKQGRVVHVKPGVVHTFYLEPGSRMVCFSSEPFDVGSQDFIRWPDFVEGKIPADLPLQDWDRRID